MAKQTASLEGEIAKLKAKVDELEKEIETLTGIAPSIPITSRI